MKKLMILILLIVITGCSNLDNMIPQDKEPIKLLGASGKVIMNIFYPQQKGTVYNSLSFSPVISLQNTGSYNAEGQVCISGLDPVLFSGASSCDCLSYSFNKLPEEKTYESQSLSFGPYSVSTTDKPSTSQSLTAINKYKYSSVAYFKPCIKQKNDFANCNIKTQEVSNGPLSISSITEILSPASQDTINLAFEIKLTNTGNGQVINVEDVSNECSFNPENKVKVRAYIENLPFIGNTICNEASVDKGKATIRCVVGEVNLYDSFGNYVFEKEFETPSKLTVEYGYSEFASVSFNLA